MSAFAAPADLRRARPSPRTRDKSRTRLWIPFSLESHINTADVGFLRPPLCPLHELRPVSSPMPYSTRRLFRPDGRRRAVRRARRALRFTIRSDFLYKLTMSGEHGFFRLPQCSRSLYGYSFRKWAVFIASAARKYRV
ncbi:hypothetical protein EVAR_35412_1 [Eumeta japonica]|uniref:Uncharacterized protein n=1 Tax=Eumeta variegata TaxID=151549 RepID=A0A4C1X8F8_EUMVA|nr:hypothetical protein EVAR_35412_1 [Eumeta japonica]